ETRRTGTMRRTRRCARGLLVGIGLGIGVGLAATPVAALGPGNPPIINVHDVSQATFVSDAFAYVDPNDVGPQLVACGRIEIPGGFVPSNVRSVTVQVPGGGSLAMDFARYGYLQDEYRLNLTRAGVAGFPTGSYVFTVTDTAGGSTAAVTAVTAFASL